MTRITSLAVLAVAAFSPLVSAGVEFISPKAGSDLTAGTSITVQWKEGGTGPKLTELTSYQLFLIAGGNKDEEQVRHTSSQPDRKTRANGDSVRSKTNHNSGPLHSGQRGLIVDRRCPIRRHKGQCIVRTHSPDSSGVRC
jgi:hypothetical protein